MSVRKLSIPGAINIPRLGGASATELVGPRNQKRLAESLRRLRANPSIPAPAFDGDLSNLGGDADAKDIKVSCAAVAGRSSGRKRHIIPDIKKLSFSIAAGTGLLAGLRDDTDWDTDAERKFLHGDASPRSLDPLWESMFLVHVDPVMRAFVSLPAGGLDKDMSEMLTDYYQSQYALIIDPTGRGKDLALDPTLIEDIPAGGFDLVDDQVFQMQDRTFARFDALGEDEVEDYEGGNPETNDLTLDHDIDVVVLVGLKARFEDFNPFGD